MASIDQPLLATSASDDALAAIGGRVAAYVSLTKPRLVLLVLVTVAVGFLLGARGPVGSQRRSCRWRRPWWEPRWWPGAPARSTSGWSASAMPGCGGRPTGPFPAAG